MHPGQWLWEEGQACRYGMDFKKTDKKRGQLMIEASASSSFPMAVAYCHYRGWNGLKKDRKKAFDMCVKIEKETNGYHWAQYMLGKFYENGYGVDKDKDKLFEYHTKAAEQGNTSGMNDLAVAYDAGWGCDKNMNKVFELYERSARLGDKCGMSNLAICYIDGDGVAKSLSKAKEWFAKAIAQGHIASPEELATIGI